MRIEFEKLIDITSRITPKAQASWFKKHFGITPEYDCKGVIITEDAFKELVSRKYGTKAVNDDKAFNKPTVKLLKKNAKTLAA